MKKYCAFGIHGELNNKGTLVDKSSLYYIVKAEGYGIYNIAIPKLESIIKFFESEKERNEFVEVQNRNSEQL